MNKYSQVTSFAKESLQLLSHNSHAGCFWGAFSWIAASYLWCQSSTSFLYSSLLAAFWNSFSFESQTNMEKEIKRHHFAAIIAIQNSWIIKLELRKIYISLYNMQKFKSVFLSISDRSYVFWNDDTKAIYFRTWNRFSWTLQKCNLQDPHLYWKLR